MEPDDLHEPHKEVDEDPPSLDQKAGERKVVDPIDPHRKQRVVPTGLEHRASFA